MIVQPAPQKTPGAVDSLVLKPPENILPLSLNHLGEGRYRPFAVSNQEEHHRLYSYHCYDSASVESRRRR